MTEEYRHDGGSNRAHDPEGNLIGWFVYTGSDRTNLELVDREGTPLTVERTAGGIVVRDQAGEVRIPRPVTLDDPFYLAVDPDGCVKVYVDGRGNLLTSLEEFRRAAGREERP
jgi:hypothetical protein